MRTTADISIRPLREDDYAGLARVHNAIDDTPATVEEMRHEVERIDRSRFVSEWLIAEDHATGEIVGYAGYRHAPWAYHPDKYRAFLDVHPDHQGRGIGRRLIRLVHSPRALPDAFFLAKLRDFYIGLSMMLRSDGDPLLLRQELTGVLAPYRGLGIAMALKVRTIDYAQTHGYLRIRTFNSSKNEAMVAINTRFGFVRQPAWIAFQKALRPPPPV